MSLMKDEPSQILVEYAKSSRSTCRAKKNCVVDKEAAKIDKNQLRIGITSGSAEGHNRTFFKHYECHPAKWLQQHLNSPEEMVGFQELKEEGKSYYNSDQNMLKERFLQLNQEVNALEQQAQKEKEAKAMEKAAEAEKKKAEKAEKAAKKKAEKDALREQKDKEKAKVSKKKKKDVEPEVSSEAVVPAA